MGSSESNVNKLAQYHLEQTDKSFAVLSKGSNASEKYVLKTYHTSSLEEHTKRLKYFQEYKQKMKDTTEIVRLVQVIEQKNQNFCTHDYKTNLIYEYSDINIESQIRERVSISSLSTVLKRPDEYTHFGYDDLCNILYTCLSALWIIKELSSKSYSSELRNYKTVFLTTNDILLMPDGAIKILDPYLFEFENRYLNNKKVSYSPQKMKNFMMADDEKCSLFQLGVMMLKISLLQSNQAINLLYCQNAVQQKLDKAKEIYSNELQEVLGINVFDIIKKMVEVDRQKRFSLEEAISYAEEMYEQLESSITKVSLQERVNNSSEDKKQLLNTNHSSSAKKCSPKLQRLEHFKNQQNGEEYRCSRMSPKISNFTIKQTEHENEEQSSMLSSLKVQQPVRHVPFTSSVGTAGVFKNVVLNDSYAYNPYVSEKEVSFTEDEGQLFTDPQLLKTIKRELEDIEERKRIKLEKSRVLERKDRYTQEDEKKRVQINNQVYLTQ